jgi:hypothetical protein
MPRPAIMEPELKKEAEAIIAKYGLEYTGHSFRKPKPIQSTWDRHYYFQFFIDPRRLQGCCGVIEMHQCYVPREATFPAGITSDEWTTLFKFHVRDILHRAQRRMALVTLINSQKAFIPFLQAAGFKKVSEGFNPGTRRKVNVWALSI